MAKFIISDPPHVEGDLPSDALPLTLDDPEFRVGARLCNFPTGKDTIRSSQAKWIADNVEPLFRQLSDCSIDLIGHASRLGSASSNMALSGRRMDAIHDLIETRAATTTANVFFRKADAQGEDQATGFGFKEADNSGTFRAVDVLVFGTKRPPIRIPIPKLKRQGTTQFRIRMVVGAGVGLPKAVIDAIRKALNVAKNAKTIIPVTADVLLFEIVENNVGSPDNMAALFAYVGGGFGIGIGTPEHPKAPKVPSVTVSLQGPLTSFRTSRPLFLPTFAGEASLGQPPQITVGGRSINSVVQLTMESRNLVLAGSVISPRTIVIETGSGFSITLFSVTKGALIMVGPPSRFIGP